LGDLNPTLTHGSTHWLTRVHSPYSISIGSATFAQLTAECRWAGPGACPFPQNCPACCNLDPHRIHGSLGPPESKTQTVSLVVRPFYTAHRSVIGHALPLRTAPSHGAKWTASNTLFFRPIWVQIPNVISIGSAIVAQLTAQCRCSGMSFPLKIARSLGSDLDPYLGLTHGSVGSPEFTTQTTSRLVQLFCAQLKAECRYACLVMSFPLKLPLCLLCRQSL